MLTYLRYFQKRYLNEKGQGLVEYAVVVAVVVAIGVAVIALTTGDDGIAGSIKSLYDNVFKDAGTKLAPAAS
ncbi:MAG: pilin [Sporomusaceae bacterium]|nr:pilin [Sporomusaceae bacterium]